MQWSRRASVHGYSGRPSTQWPRLGRGGESTSRSLRSVILSALTMYTSVLALAGLFSSKFNDYPIHQFPKVHHGVDSIIFPQLSIPFDFIIGS